MKSVDCIQDYVLAGQLVFELNALKFPEVFFFLAGAQAV
jgi:hypothetical protein